MIILILIIAVVIIVWVLKHDEKMANVANENLVAVNHNAVLAAVEQRLLIKLYGAKKAASLILEEVENEPEAYPILVQLYKEAGLSYDNAHSDPKTRKMVLRAFEAKCESAADLMDNITLES